jgi:hypothetical protein
MGVCVMMPTYRYFSVHGHAIKEKTTKELVLA